MGQRDAQLTEARRIGPVRVTPRMSGSAELRADHSMVTPGLRVSRCGEARTHGRPSVRIPEEAESTDWLSDGGWVHDVRRRVEGAEWERGHALHPDRGADS
jgi:hypothetical protein